MQPPAGPGPLVPAHNVPAPEQQFAPPPVDYDRTPSGRVFSNLNLNGPAAARVRPRIGEWGPTTVPGTREKRRMRWLVPVIFGVLAIVVGLSMYWFYSVLLGKPFFGM